MVFSTRLPEQARGQTDKSVRDSEKIVKATEYVQHSKAETPFKSYVVLETDGGNSLVIEKPAVGVAPWSENPSDLDDRNSLAKVIRSIDCRSGGKTVGVLKSYNVQEVPEGCSDSLFAQAVYCFAAGQAESIGIRSGFRLSEPQRFAPCSRLPPVSFAA